MKLEQYKIVFASISIIAVLLIASPALALFVHLPETKPFSEIYLLGANQRFSDYPLNITIGQNFTLYICVDNHLSSSAYYTIDVKLRNATEPLPDSTASPLPSLYQEQFACSSGQTIQKQLNFVVVNASFSKDYSLINSIRINDFELQVDKQSTLNESKKPFFELFFELSVFDSKSGLTIFTGQITTLQLDLVNI